MTEGAQKPGLAPAFLLVDRTTVGTLRASYRNCLWVEMGARTIQVPFAPDRSAKALARSDRSPVSKLFTLGCQQSILKP